MSEMQDSPQNQNVLPKPGLWTGLLVGLLLSAVFMAVIYLADQIAGLPFLPFDLFDWIAQTLPGAVITFGIDTMVAVITALGIGDLDSAAKTAEQMMGLALFWLLGGLFSMALFATLRSSKSSLQSSYPGIIGGALLAVPMVLINQQVNATATTGPFLSMVWILLVFVAFGYAVNTTYNALVNAGGKAKNVDTEASRAQMQAEMVNRREFLVRFGGATAVLTLVGAGLGSLLSSRPTGPVRRYDGAANDEEILTGSGDPLPNAGDPMVPAPGTRPEYTPISDHYRIDIASRPPVIDGESYTLPITGLVENEVAWTLDDIRAMDSVAAFITMSCISNRIAGDLISTTKWTGVPMQRILDEIQPTADAAALLIQGADGFDEYVPLEDIRNDERIMLCYAWDDAPLPERNGFPLRIHIPNRYGMKQPKWINNIEVVDAAGDGYWVRRGWSATAFVKMTSVIDTVATDAVYQQDGDWMVPIGGIAWAGDRGISKVEVSIDEGEWIEADVRSAMSDRTWVIWRYDWAFTEGNHTFAVRCTDDNGESQITERSGTRPDGATGIHSQQATVNEPEPATEPA